MRGCTDIAKRGCGRICRAASLAVLCLAAAVGQASPPDADDPGPLARTEPEQSPVSLEEQAVSIQREGSLPLSRLALEAQQVRLLPDTPLTLRPVQSPAAPLLQGNPYDHVLERRVSMQLRDATVGDFISTLASEEHINLIADQELSDQRIHIDVRDAPLREVLEFIARNYNVHFYPRDNTIWVTRGEDERPMHTVIFPLQQGIPLQADGWGEDAPAAGVDTFASLGSKAAVTPTGLSSVEQMIAALIPPNEHARTHLDPNTNTLIVRNTAANLRKIADIVHAVDVRPIQISIEARFLEVRHADLREVGLDWLLESPFIATQKGVFRDGQWQREPRSLVDSGASIGFSPYTSDETGPTPLGPQGPFGEVRAGNPPSEDQGLNLTYRGVMTDPMFQAVLHALEVSGRGFFLSAPRVTTVNNHPAKMRDGQDLLYYQQFQAQAFTFGRGAAAETVTSLVPQGAPILAELGITLVVVPSVGADLRRINMLISSTISELDRFENYQDDRLRDNEQPDQREVQQVVVRLPIITRREVQTKALVESGETVVLGGLIRSVEQQTEHRVPILGSLPLIGRLFRRTSVTEDQRNLLIFITAEVLPDEGQAN